MFEPVRQFSLRKQRSDDSPLSLWNDVFLIAIGFFCLGVSLFGFLVEVGPRFAQGAHIDLTPLVSFALVGSIALFFIVEGYMRIGRTIHHLDERLKPKSMLN
jgi:hypothetical protein